MSETSVEYEGAQSGALSAQDISAQLRDLPVDFEDLISDATTTMSPDPGITGWSIFGDQHSDHMMDVQEHAVDLAENISASAEEIADTDSTTTEEFTGTDILHVTGDLPLIC